MSLTSVLHLAADATASNAAAAGGVYGALPELVKSIPTLVGVLVTAGASAMVAIYTSRRSAPHTRNRLLADMEILERAAKLGVSPDRISAWAEQELSNLYDRYGNKRRGDGRTGGYRKTPGESGTT